MVGCLAHWVVGITAEGGSTLGWHEQLSRYTHRTSVSNERIRAVSEREVAFSVRANDKGAKRLERLPGTEFVRRLLLHIQPTGVKRIRHYGVLASVCKGVKLPAARAALQMPAPNLQALACAQAFMARVARIDVGLCPCCGGGVCASRRCWWVLGACLGQLVHSCPSAGGRRDGLARCDKSAAVCRAI